MSYSPLSIVPSFAYQVKRHERVVCVSTARNRNKCRKLHHKSGAATLIINQRRPSQRHKMRNHPLLQNSSIYLLGLMTCAAVIVQALATSSSSSSYNNFSRNRGHQWGVSRGGSTKLVQGESSTKSYSASSLPMSKKDGEIHSNGKTNMNSDESIEIPSPIIQPLNGAFINHKDSPPPPPPIRNVNVNLSTSTINTKPPTVKTIVTPGGFADTLIPAAYVAETNLPTDIGHYRIRAYRIDSRYLNSRDSTSLGAGAGLGSEPCVIYCTDKPPFGKRGVVGGGAKGVPVRIHDQCFTSEVFRSRRCDCREQLKMSLEYIRENGGAIIYLQQEGRGIGLANKVAAYALQDVGLDTVDANTHLGFPEDARQYGVVPSLLADMGIDSIRLMTNNPRKIERLRALGVDVLGTIPMVVPEANPYNRKYLETKKERMNHSNFGSMLSSSPSSILSSDYSHVEFMMGKRNGKSLAENYINDGEEMAAAVVTSVLMEKESEKNGVSASADGYCFGRKSVELAIAAVARGELIVVVDDESRENEGDFIMAAEMATPEKMAEIIRYSSGVVCIGMEGERMDALKLPPMVVNNEDPKGTAFSVSVDATKEHGITTGISAKDRALTSLMLAKKDSTVSDFHRPGHIFPLRAQENGVLARDGHTEAAVDFSRLAGCAPAGLLCEIVSEENPVEMARLPELKRFCERRGYVLTSIADLQQYRRDTGL